ncbi:hypothetical protein [Haloplanus halobius]|uniref:hypothetical protein n=1 Tax=Haloplanus halobius TaxID=2934938 RepID=UPI00200F2310|nr:hypothetical protein [Haloplanus sp. XH21]
MFLALLVGVGGGQHPTLDFHHSLLGGATLATLLFWQAVFRNPPDPGSATRTTAVGVGWQIAVLCYLVLRW